MRLFFYTIFFVVFTIFVLSYCLADTYILTDNGRGLEKIEVELLTEKPINIQDSPLVKVYVIKFKDKDIPVAAGMSGSPLFKDGKIIGALFAGYSFQKEPLAFVIPIEYMDTIGKNDSYVKVSNQLPLVLNFPDSKSLNFYLSDLSNLSNYSSNLSKSSKSSKFFDGVFTNKVVFNDISLSKSSNSKDSNDYSYVTKDELKSGSSISVALVDGDIKLFVTGTLTKINSDGTFVAFGHPMFDLGKISVPVYTSKVITIVNRYDDSFKLSSLGDKKIGSLIFDGAYGVLGKIGQESKMIPLYIDIFSSNKRIKNYNCYVIDNQKLVYPLSLITFYSAVSNYLDKSTPYEFGIDIGFVNGKNQKIVIPSYNSSIENLLSEVYKYLVFLSSLPSVNNKVNYIRAYIDVTPQKFGILNNISVSNREDNNINFDVNYFDPVNGVNGKESVNVVFPSEEMNNVENLNFAVGGSLFLANMFEDLGIAYAKPRDFDQFITLTNMFFFLPDLKSLSVLILTNLYGALDQSGKVVPLTAPQFYKFYLQFSMPFIYFSYYPIIIKKNVNFVPVGYNIFEVDVTGSISQLKKQKKEEKTSLAILLDKISNEADDNIFKRKNNSYKRKDKSYDVEKELYKINQEYYENSGQDKKNNDSYQENVKNESLSKDLDNNFLVNLSNYNDLINGEFVNVSVDYFSNIYFSNFSSSNIKVDKNLFRVLSYKDGFIGFSYSFDNSTEVYRIGLSGNLQKLAKYKGIFSDVRISNGRIIASTFDGRILLINIDNFKIEKEIFTNYIFENADFYKGKIVALNVKYPSSLVTLSIDGKVLNEIILPFTKVSNLFIDGDNILFSCYGGSVAVFNDKQRKYFQTYQENVTAINVIDGNLFMGTYKVPYLYVVPSYNKSSAFNRAILYDGFGSFGYIEDIVVFNDKVFLCYKGDKLTSLFAIDKDDLLGNISISNQITSNLNWSKVLSVFNYHWFIPFVKLDDSLGVGFISSSFTTMNFIKQQTNKNASHLKGEYISKVFDAGKDKHLRSLFVRSQGNYEAFVRMGNNPVVDQTWTDWVSINDLSSKNPKYRYFQYKLVLYPSSKIFQIYGVLDKINFKPFFIVDLSRKAYKFDDSLNILLWDPNGDKLNVCLKLFQDNKWYLIDKKEVMVKETDINSPSFDNDIDLSLEALKQYLNKNGKVKIKVSVDDSLSNPDNYFVQEQEFEIFIDNDKPVVIDRSISDESNMKVLRVKVKDDSLVEAFIQIEQDYLIPMKLVNHNANVYEFYLKVNRELIGANGIKIILRDEASNTEEVML